MENTTKPTPTGKPAKPAKPYAEFPLFPHATRRWAKKIRGKLHFFGPWNDWEAALAKYKSQADDLHAGRQPRQKLDGVHLGYAVNKFLDAKSAARAAGELSDILFVKYHQTCARLVEHFGKDRLVSDLRPEDFGAYREKLAAKWGPITLGCEIQRVRTMFKHAFDNRHIPFRVEFGTMFQKPSKRVRTVHRANQPKKRFAPAEIRALLKAADNELKAMILLGLNCGWGNNDIAGLRLSHLSLKDGVALYPRAKTGIGRRVTLWPETVKAVRKVIDTRPTPAKKEYAELVFLTRFGNPWVVSAAYVDESGEKPKVHWTNVDSVGLEFGKLLRKPILKRDGQGVALKRDGVNFYTLRHTFKTIAEGAGDIPAVDRIMGHLDESDTGTHYREWADDASDDSRLCKVTDHVHKWLFGK